MLIAILFVVQLLTAAVGNTFVQKFIDGDANRTALTFGALLMMFSGIIIAAIGILLYGVLRVTKSALAIWVPVIRITECTVALIFGVYLLTTLQTVTDHLLWVYVLAGAAGVILCYVLFTSTLIPRPIVTLGGLGYASLLLGVPLDFAGVIDMNAGFGQVLFVPGGVFEVLVLPVWLVARGFTSPEPRSSKIPVGSLA